MYRPPRVSCGLWFPVKSQQLPFPHGLCPLAPIEPCYIEQSCLPSCSQCCPTLASSGKTGSGEGQLCEEGCVQVDIMEIRM